MPVYYFDASGGGKLFTDAEGQDLAGPQVVRAEAVAALPQIARIVLGDTEPGTVVVTVRDEQGAAVLRASLCLRVEYHLERAPEWTCERAGNAVAVSAVPN